MWMLLSSLVLVFVTFKSEAKHISDGKYISEELDEACLGSPRVIFADEEGDLYSPGFLENKGYPPDLKCSYQFQAPQDMHVRIKFHTLDIDPADDCKYDNLSIINFNTQTDYDTINVHCGNNVPGDYVSSWFVFQLVFKTNSNGARRGFHLSYSAVDSPDVCDKDEQFTCRNRKCVNIDDKCDGVDDCGDGTDEETDLCKKPVMESGECGKPDINPLQDADNDRIVGGKEAIPNSWPWMVELQKTTMEPAHICGGTLINSQWVLSASHCFEYFRKPSDLRIHLGKHSKYDKDKHEVIRYAKRIVVFDDIAPEIFEENGKFDLQNDITLIQLNAPVQFSRYIKPACLPDKNLKLDKNSRCYATGWGFTKGIGSPAKLKQTYHPIQSDKYCKVPTFMSKTMICAGSLAEDDGICPGDSGGPLNCKIGNEWTVAGASSFILDGCGSKGFPSVFARVSDKTEYIRRIIKKYSK